MARDEGEMKILVSKYEGAMKKEHILQADITIWETNPYNRGLVQYNSRDTIGPHSWHVPDKLF
jgi:hypothetical protein